MSDTWGPPWERRFNAFYKPNGTKRIGEITIAWKSSDEANALASHVVKAVNNYNEMAEVIMDLSNLATLLADGDHHPEIEHADKLIAKLARSKP